MLLPVDHSSLQLSRHLEHALLYGLSIEVLQLVLHGQHLHVGVHVLAGLMATPVTLQGLAAHMLTIHGHDGVDCILMLLVAHKAIAT